MTTPDIAPPGVTVTSSTSAEIVAKTGTTGGDATNALSAGLPKANIDVDITDSPAFNVPGIDISVDYQRDENAGTLITRGTGFAFGNAGGAFISYQVEDGAGGSTTVTSPSFNIDRNDNVFRTLRFIYEPISGNASLLIDDVEQWTNPTKTPGQNLFWGTATNLFIGEEIDGSGEDKAILDNFVLIRLPGAGSLPVELTHFSAKPQDGRVVLHWRTASEQDNEAFTVERSAKLGDWEPVLQVAGSGTTRHAVDYEAVDKLPLAGRSFYRLKQVDFDGTSSYSDIVSVDLAQASITGVFPNPATNVLYLTGEWGVAAAPRILSASGQVIHMPSGNRAKTATGFKLDISKLAPGTYILQTTRGASTTFVKR